MADKIFDIVEARKQTREFHRAGDVIRVINAMIENLARQGQWYAPVDITKELTTKELFSNHHKAGTAQVDRIQHVLTPAYKAAMEAFKKAGYHVVCTVHTEIRRDDGEAEYIHKAYMNVTWDNE
jgi:nucleoside-diphosphate-sugar epimerase